MAGNEEEKGSQEREIYKRIHCFFRGKNKGLQKKSGRVIQEQYCVSLT